MVLDPCQTLMITAAPSSSIETVTHSLGLLVLCQPHTHGTKGRPSSRSGAAKIARSPCHLFGLGHSLTECFTNLHFDALALRCSW
ncbi:hypothetical protein Pelo_17576 [Pelomyxa schiedti]|nr:hypothetical protein Pelo_17576 [Pelomyxa schiedti]